MPIAPALTFSSPPRVRRLHYAARRARLVKINFVGAASRRTASLGADFCRSFRFADAAVKRRIATHLAAMGM